MRIPSPAALLQRSALAEARQRPCRLAWVAGGRPLFIVDKQTTLADWRELERGAPVLGALVAAVTKRRVCKKLAFRRGFSASRRISSRRAACGWER
jgi:hypothetical protein